MFVACLFEAKNRMVEFDYQNTNKFQSVRKSKKDVQVFLMSNSVNLVRLVLCSTFDLKSFKAKNKAFEFDYS